MNHVHVVVSKIPGFSCKVIERVFSNGEDAEKYAKALKKHGDWCCKYLYNVSYEAVEVESEDDESPSETEKVDNKLDKIKERIALEKLGYPPNADYYKAIMKCLQIIDDAK